MQIFSREYSLECAIRLNICEYSVQNEYFKANIRQYEKMYLHQIEYLHENLGEYFEANMMRLNGVCKNAETCEYEANKINIRFEVANTANPG